MRSLEVHLYGVHVGDLVGESWRDFDFVSSNVGVREFGLGSTVLSESVPLLPHQPRGRAARRRNFFDELLPEGVTRLRLAERARISTTDTLGLLAAYGRDVAGAVQVIDPAAADALELPRARILTTAQIVDLLKDTDGSPLGNAPLSGKISLAGVQEKLLLARADGHWAQCLYGYPSTHIIKPVSRQHMDMIFNEEYASRIARALGLADYATWIQTFDDSDVLVIERYDRSDTTADGRLHQEDMSQVLGAAGAEKYQDHGGKVSLARIASVVASTQGQLGLDQLLKMVTLSLAVGNLDMHAKNISLLHPPDGSARLAPAYDVVPLTHYVKIDGRMAMAVNGVYEHAQIGRSDVTAEAGMWGLPIERAIRIIDDTVTVIRATVQEQQPHIGAVPELAQTIDAFAARLLKPE